MCVCIGPIAIVVALKRSNFLSQDSRPFRPCSGKNQRLFLSIFLNRLERMEEDTIDVTSFLSSLCYFSLLASLGTGEKGLAEAEATRGSSHSKMNFFATNRSASIYWPKIVYTLAFLRITAWVILIAFCLICFESSVTELNRIIKESRPHFDGLTLDQTKDFLIVYLIFGVLYVLIDGKYIF